MDQDERDKPGLGALYGAEYYVNAGIALRVLTPIEKPKQPECQLLARFDELNGYGDLARALHFDNAATEIENHRCEIIESGVTSVANQLLPLLTEADVKQFIESGPPPGWMIDGAIQRHIYGGIVFPGGQRVKPST